MPIFKFLSTDNSYKSAEISAPDAGRILHIVDQLDCRDADVLKEDTYSFSLRLSSNGLWTIFQRKFDEMQMPVRSYG